MDLRLIFQILLAAMVFVSCDPEEVKDGDLTAISYDPRPYEIAIPAGFPVMDMNGNPPTLDGVSLGRRLFYDPILSRDSSMSCSSCHLPQKSFTDGVAKSTGIQGLMTSRSSMSLINIGFVRNGLFWDGREASLESQALLPIEDPIELHHSWPEVIEKLKNHPTYPSQFRKAFGISNKSEISKELAAKALAQFQRIMISSNSKYDKVQRGEARFTDLELIGEAIFMDLDPDLPDAECGHCHIPPLFDTDQFLNNGLQNSPGSFDGFADFGRGQVTGILTDRGKFRSPTLRNIMLTAPYMHDGRLKNIDEVLQHYNSGGKPSPTKDGLITPLGLDDFHLQALKAFIHTLTDTTFINDPALQRPKN